MPIIVNMACGLANRMFQYAYYLYLEKIGCDVKIDYFKTKTLAHEDVDWFNIFPDATFRKASTVEILRMGGGKDIFSKLIRKYLNGLTNALEMPSAYSIYTPERKNENRYLLGVFQNAEIPQLIDKELVKAFKFQPFEDENNRLLADKLQSENSVGVHVRKGKDYQTRKWYKNTCSLSYYERAFAEIKRNVKNPVFYIFTDNPEWVKENFQGLDYTLINHNPIFGKNSHADMQLMSLCRHNIISNSTYSWWGAFLNSNSEKIVIIPEIWFNPETTHNYTSDSLMCKGWLKK